MKCEFGHVGLNCANIAKTVRFYTRYFGFKVGRVVPLGKGAKIVFLKSRKGYLELFQASGKARAVKNDGPVEAGFRHMAFSVSSVDRMLKRLGKDAEVTLGPLHFDGFLKGWGAAWIRDPDGRIVEISQGYKDEKKPPRVGV